MANTHDTLTGLFTDVANAIREKTGKTDAIVADNFATEIANIPKGAEVVTGVFTCSNSSNVTIPAIAGKSNIVFIRDEVPNTRYTHLAGLKVETYNLMFAFVSASNYPSKIENSISISPGSGYVSAAYGPHVFRGSYIYAAW